MYNIQCIDFAQNRVYADPNKFGANLGHFTNLGRQDLFAPVLTSFTSQFNDGFVTVEWGFTDDCSGVQLCRATWVPPYQLSTLSSFVLIATTNVTGAIVQGNMTVGVMRTAQATRSDMSSGVWSLNSVACYDAFNNQAFLSKTALIQHGFAQNLDLDLRSLSAYPRPVIHAAGFTPAVLVGNANGNNVTCVVQVSAFGLKACIFGWGYFFEASNTIIASLAVSALCPESPPTTLTNTSIAGSSVFPYINQTGHWQLLNVTCTDVHGQQTSTTPASLGINGTVVQQQFLAPQITFFRTRTGFYEPNYFFLLRFNLVCPNSALLFCSVTYTQGLQNYTFSIDALAVTSQSSTPAATAFVSFPPGMAPGLWSVSNTFCTFSNGYVVQLWSASDFAGTQSAGYLAFSITTPGDLNPPVLQTINFQHKFNDAAAFAAVVVNLTVTDDFSGVQSCMACFTSASNPKIQPVIVTTWSVPVGVGVGSVVMLTGRAIFPSFVGIGAFVLSNVTCYDYVGQALNVPSASLLADGIATSLLLSPDSGLTDTTPPAVLSFSFAPHAIDVSFQNAPVTITVSFTDDISGVSHCRATFSLPGAQNFTVKVFASQMVSGSRTNGVLSGLSTTFPAGGIPGVWTLSELDCSDQAGNVQQLASIDLLQVLVGSPSLTVSNSQVGFPPAITTVTVSPTAFNATAAPVSLTVSLAISNPTGVTSCWATIIAPNSTLISISSANFYKMNSSSYGTDLMLTLPLFSASGVYTLQSVACQCANGAISMLSTLIGTLASGVGATNVGVQDFSAPHFIAINITTPIVDITLGPAIVAVSINASDTGSGVSSCQVSFVPLVTSIGPVPRLVVSMTQIVSRSGALWMNGTENVTLSGTSTVPAATAFTGFWRLYSMSCIDYAGNRITWATSSYTLTQLINRGTVFNVTQRGSSTSLSLPTLQACSVNSSIINTSSSDVAVLISCGFASMSGASLQQCAMSVGPIATNTAAFTSVSMTQLTWNNSISAGQIQGVLIVPSGAPVETLVLRSLDCTTSLLLDVQAAMSDPVLFGVVIQQVGIPVANTGLIPAASPPSTGGSASSPAVAIAAAIVVIFSVVVAVVVFVVIRRRQRQASDRRKIALNAKQAEAGERLKGAQQHASEGNDGLNLLHGNAVSGANGVPRSDSASTTYDHIDYAALNRRAFEANDYCAQLTVPSSSSTDEVDVMLTLDKTSASQSQPVYDSINYASMNDVKGVASLTAPSVVQPRYGRLDMEAGHVPVVVSHDYSQLQHGVGPGDETDGVIGAMLASAVYDESGELRGVYSSAVLPSDAALPSFAAKPSPNKDESLKFIGPDHYMALHAGSNDNGYEYAPGLSRATTGVYDQPTNLTQGSSEEASDNKYEYAAVPTEPNQYAEADAKPSNGYYEALTTAKAGMYQVPTASAWDKTYEVSSANSDYAALVATQPASGADYGWVPTGPSLLHQLWYAADVTREAAEELLMRPDAAVGQFFVRPGTVGGEFVLTVKSGAEISHIRITRGSNLRFSVDGHMTFASVVELVNYYTVHAMECEGETALTLIKPSHDASVV